MSYFPSTLLLFLFPTTSSKVTFSTQSNSVNVEVRLNTQRSHVRCLERAPGEAAGTRTDRRAVLVGIASELRRAVAAAAFGEGRLAGLHGGGSHEGGKGKSDESLELHIEMNSAE